MSERRISSVWVAVLGILIGALAVLVVGKATEKNRRYRAEALDWRKLNLVLQKVDEMYVDTVDYDSVTEAAISAALAKLDPHSIYMPPVELEEAETELAGNFDGIGIQFNVPNDTAIVLEVIPGGPSEKIGLQAGDRLLKVDDKVIAGVNFTQDSMVRRMKGPAGTKVSLTVLRDGAVIPFEIIRDKIPVHCVDASFMVNDTTGYIRLCVSQFLPWPGLSPIRALFRAVPLCRRNSRSYNRRWCRPDSYTQVFPFARRVPVRP